MLSPHCPVQGSAEPPAKAFSNRPAPAMSAHAPLLGVSRCPAFLGCQSFHSITPASMVLNLYLCQEGEIRSDILVICVVSEERAASLVLHLLLHCYSALAPAVVGGDFLFSCNVIDCTTLGNDIEICLYKYQHRSSEG